MVILHHPREPPEPGGRAHPNPGEKSQGQAQGQGSNTSPSPAPSASPPPRSPTPEHPEGQQSDGSQHSSHGSAASSEADEVPTGPVKRKRKSRAKNYTVPAADLSDKQQEEMLEWIKGLPQLYNRKNQGHKKQSCHTHLWQERAEHYGIENYESLITWWQTLRTRFTRVHKNMTASGSGAKKNLTEKDQFVWDHASFLHGHIRHHVNPQPTQEIQRSAPAPRPAPQAQAPADPLGAHDEDLGGRPAEDLLVEADLAAIVIPQDEGKYNNYILWLTLIDQS